MEKIYMIEYSLTRQPKNNLQEDLAKLLSGDHRFLLKESVNARIRQVNEKNHRCQPLEESYTIGYFYKRDKFPADYILHVNNSMFMIRLMDIRSETLISDLILKFENK